MALCIGVIALDLVSSFLMEEQAPGRQKGRRRMEGWEMHVVLLFTECKAWTMKRESCRHFGKQPARSFLGDSRHEWIFHDIGIVCTDRHRPWPGCNPEPTCDNLYKVQHDQAVQKQANSWR